MTNWTQAQYDDWKAQRRQEWQAVCEHLGSEYPKAEKPKPIIPESVMNKTEAKFAEYLEQLKHLREIVDWRFEPIKFVLARNVKGRRNATVYIPDFLAIYPDHFTFFEVKGFYRDDAIVKSKVAAEMYPWFNWQVVKLKKGEWVFEEV